MHPRYVNRHTEIVRALSDYDRTIRSLPGIGPEGAAAALGWQFVDSRRKIDRTERLRTLQLSPERAMPGSDLFDPEMAAIISARSGDIENAIWLAFLSVHFGRHALDGWQLTARIYGGMGPTPYWTWDRTSADVTGFRGWLADTMRQRNSPLGRFGNHRKYETLDPHSPAGTASVIASYVEWAIAAGGQHERFQDAISSASGDPRVAFATLYRSLHDVRRFGRLAKFDFLTIVGKLGLAQIVPNSTYMSEATGPQRGAKLLFDGSVTSSTPASQLEASVAQLDDYLSVGMQAMEDALCNWQKSPTAYITFRG